jgi:hypothetical protein
MQVCTILIIEDLGNQLNAYLDSGFRKPHFTGRENGQLKFGVNREMEPVLKSPDTLYIW